MKLDDREKDRLGYERELKRWLDKLMGDLRSKIQRNEERLAQQEAVVFLPDDQVSSGDVETVMLPNKVVRATQLHSLQAATLKLLGQVLTWMLSAPVRFDEPCCWLYHPCCS